MKTTKIFFDTEFSGLHKNTTLISIGLVADDGQTFYAELNDFDESQIDEWIQDNVISNLRLGKYEGVGNEWFHPDKVELKCNKSTLKIKLNHWFEQFDKVEIWSDCLSYDWVLFCDIFGTAFDIPSNIYYIPFDLSTMFKLCNIDPDISREEFSGIKHLRKHNSLDDAIVIRECYEELERVLYCRGCDIVEVKEND